MENNITRRKLGYKALTHMNGQKVLVKDIEYGAYNQICEVKVETTWLRDTRKRNESYIEVITKLWLENEEFVFEYDRGKCVNGEFEVYTLIEEDMANK